MFTRGSLFCAVYAVQTEDLLGLEPNNADIDTVQHHAQEWLIRFNNLKYNIFIATSLIAAFLALP